MSSQDTGQVKFELLSCSGMRVIFIISMLNSSKANELAWI